MDKIFIITQHSNLDNIYNIAEQISNIFDMEIAKTLTTQDINNIYYQHYPFTEMLLSFKNNALLYCLTNDIEGYSECITSDDLYSKDIFCIPIDGFVNIPDNVLPEGLFVFVDSNKIHTRLEKYNKQIVLSVLDNKSNKLCITNSNNNEIVNIIENFIINE